MESLSKLQKQIFAYCKSSYALPFRLSLGDELSFMFVILLFDIICQHYGIISSQL